MKDTGEFVTLEITTLWEPVLGASQRSVVRRFRQERSSGVMASQERPLPIVPTQDQPDV